VGRLDVRRTNLAVLALVLAAGATGAATFLVGTPSWWPLVAGHGAIGLALAAFLWWKGRVVLRGLRARWPAPSAWLSLATLAVLLGVLASGVWSAAARGPRLGTWTLLELHVAGAILLVPLLLAHLPGRWAPPARRDLSRRTLLRAAGLVGAGVALRAGTEGLARAARLAGGRRRFTGSHLAGGPGEPFPAVSWLFDDPDPVSTDRWRLVVDGLVARPLALSYEELLAVEARRLHATLDCTGGWYTVQAWEGVPLGELLDRAGLRPGVRSVIVSSVTGYARAFPVAEARRLLLALRVAGRPLDHGHGAPARLVAPGRRGYWWVKWVARVEASASFPWLQPPVPLQ
jgi:DMSO/TMAO reductase YedYZ molybdopterin-dependent catalytic subunit